jgi:predicted esterase
VRRCAAIFFGLQVLLVASAFAADGLVAGGISEFQVELTPELRRIAGRGELSSATHAAVAVAVPPQFDPAREWPVMIVSATSDRPWHSSRGLLAEYAGAARAEGWILLAADPLPDVPKIQDDATLRFAVIFAALAVLRSQWPGADKAPLAFGGFSGGSKYSGWLSAAFTSQGRRIIGIYLAGINVDTVASTARDMNVLDERYKRIPVFLQSGDKDVVSTPGDHRRVQSELERAGFKRTRIEYFVGTHEVEPALLRTALHWFSELDAQPSSVR